MSKNDAVTISKENVARILQVFKHSLKFTCALALAFQVVLCSYVFVCTCFYANRALLASAVLIAFNCVWFALLFLGFYELLNFWTTKAFYYLRMLEIVIWTTATANVLFVIVICLTEIKSEISVVYLEILKFVFIALWLCLLAGIEFDCESCRYYKALLSGLKSKKTIL